jgi:pyruvate kinase
MAAVYAANHYKSIKAIVGLTESGSSIKLMSRITTSLPIIGMSRHTDTLNMMALYRGVTPLRFDSTQSKQGQITSDVVEHLKNEGVLVTGDQIIFTYGDQMETIGATNTCKIVTVN